MENKYTVYWDFSKDTSTWNCAFYYVETFPSRTIHKPLLGSLFSTLLKEKYARVWQCDAFSCRAHKVFVEHHY